MRVPRARGATVSLLRQIPVSHVRVAPFIVNNNRKQWDRSVRSLPATAGRFRTDQAGMLPIGFVSPKCAVRPRPSCRGASQRARARLLPSIVALQCVWKHEDEHRVAHSSRFQTANLVLAAGFPHPGFASLLRSPRIEGWAERRETFGCSAEHPCGVSCASKDARERAYDAIRQAPSEAPCVP